MHPAANKPLSIQLAALERHLRAAPALWQVIETARVLLPGSYISGGAITQTIWNQSVGRPATERLQDIDIVYFDGHGTLESQGEMERALRQRISSGIPIDLTNEALTHTWYESKFGSTIRPYQSAEAAINTWLPAFAIGVRLVEAAFEVYAPYGLHDLFAMHIRPNKLQISRTIYEQMVVRYTSRWPEATVEAW